MQVQTGTGPSVRKSKRKLSYKMPWRYDKFFSRNVLWMFIYFGYFRIQIMTGPVNQVNHNSWVAVVTPTDRPKSVRNCCLIELFCGVVCVVTCPFDISVGVGAFVIGLGQISSFLFPPLQSSSPCTLCKRKIRNSFD